MNNPWAQPPLPSDWHVMPTHPVRVVPYFLAPLWEERLAARREEERERRLKLQKQRNGYAKGSVDESSVVHVPKDCYLIWKKTFAALLQAGRRMTAASGQSRSVARSTLMKLSALTTARMTSCSWAAMAKRTMILPPQKCQNRVRTWSSLTICWPRSWSLEHLRTIKARNLGKSNFGGWMFRC
jgi:R3H-associated N-terminal domain